MEKYAINKTIECRKIKKEMHKHRRKVGELRKGILVLLSENVKSSLENFAKVRGLNDANKLISKELFRVICNNNHLLLLVKLINSGTYSAKSKCKDTSYFAAKTDNDKFILITHHYDDASVNYFEFRLKGNQ